MKNFSLFLISLLTFTGFNCALVQANSNPELTKEENQILAENELPAKQLTFHLIDIQSKQEIRSFQAKLPMIPASLTKVPTTFMALKTLGAKKKFSTILSYTGKIQNGVLEGNIYLKGYGDPTFGRRELFNFALSLHSIGVKQVIGKFYYDDSHLLNIQKLSIIGLGDQTYNPSVNALPLDFNQFNLLKDKEIIPPLIPNYISVPQLENFNVKVVEDNFIPGQRFRYQVTPEGIENWELSEKQDYSIVERLPVRNPSLYTASLFQNFAKKLGIQIPNPEQGIATEKTTLIAKQEGQGVLRLAESNLEYSNNLLAELLLLHSVKKQGHTPNDLEDAAKSMAKWYSDNYQGMGWERAAFINGSGLTSENRISAQTLSQFLSHIQKEKFDGRHYWSLFPMAGRAPWLKKRLNHPDLLYKVWTKTGSLDFVNNLTGYFISNSGKKMAFSIFINDKKRRREIDRDQTEKAEQLRLDARSWRKMANKVQDELLQYWIQNF